MHSPRCQLRDSKRYASNLVGLKRYLALVGIKGTTSRIAHNNLILSNLSKSIVQTILIGVVYSISALVHRGIPGRMIILKTIYLTVNLPFNISNPPTFGPILEVTTPSVRFYPNLVDPIVKDFGTHICTQ